MNKNILKGKWNQMKGQVQKQWGKITDDEIDIMEGDANKLVGLIQERYGKSQEEAEREVQEWQEKHSM